LAESLASLSVGEKKTTLLEQYKRKQKESKPDILHQWSNFLNEVKWINLKK